MGADTADHQGERQEGNRQIGSKADASQQAKLVGALERIGEMPDPKNPPLVGVLLKRASDIQTYRGGESGPKRYM